MKTKTQRSLISLLGIFVLMVAQVGTAFATETQIYSKEYKNEKANTLILDSDDTGGNMTLQFGQTLGKTLTYNTTSNAFVFNDNVIVGGNLNVNGVITAGSSNVQITTASGQLDGSKLANDSVKDTSIDFGMGANQVGADDITATDNFTNSASTNVQGVLEDFDALIGTVDTSGLTGTTQNSFILNSDNSAGSVLLQFGQTALGTLTHNGTLFVFDDDVRVDGTLTVNGNSNHLGNMTVTGTTTLNGATTVNNTFSVNNNTNLNGTLNVTGASTLVNTTVTGTATVNGVSNLNGNVNITGTTIQTGNMTVNGISNLNGNVNITGVTTQTGNVQLNGILNLNGNLSMNGTLAGATLSGDSNTLSNINWSSLKTRTKTFAVNMAGITVSEDGTNNQADLSSDVETGTNPHQYYLLKTKQNSLQDLDLKLKVKLPEDFLDFSTASNDIRFSYKNTGASASESKIDLTVQDSAGTNAFTPVTGLFNTSWTDSISEITGGSFSAGSYVYITLKGYASYSSGYRSPYMGEIVLTYTGR